MRGIVNHSQSSQNRKFAMSLQYPKKEVRDEVDFLNADKMKVSHKLISTFGHQSFLQGDSFIIDGHDQAFSQYSKWQVCNILTVSQKKS